MRAAGQRVIASDLYGDRAVDFLCNDPPSPGRFAAIVTNSPFNALDAFISRGLYLMEAGVTRSLVLLVASAPRHPPESPARRRLAFWNPSRAPVAADDEAGPIQYIDPASRHERVGADHQGPPTVL
jgi:hypothetical protein